MSETPAQDAKAAARRMAYRDGSGDSPTAWFDTLYAAADAGRAVVPWDRGHPHPLVVNWAKWKTDHNGRAIVIAAGPGHDAEYVASLGYETTAFDISPTAVAAARSRFPDSNVSYLTADLLELPAEWQAAFDLVVEVWTVQALPRSLRKQTTRAIASTVAPAGTLLVVAEPPTDPANDNGPPWPLTEDEVKAFADYGLDQASLELTDPYGWWAVFRAPASGG